MRLGYRKIFLGKTSLHGEKPLELVDQLFEDRVSSLQSNRPELDDLIKFSSKGDQILVQSFDQLGKDLKDLYKFILLIIDKGASVNFLDEQITFGVGKKSEENDSNIRILEKLTVFEARIIKQRQSEGIHKAKKLKKYKGRRSTLDPSIIQEEYEKVGKVSAVASNLKISRMSVYRLLQKHKNRPTAT